jgi:hypothetical protein
VPAVSASTTPSGAPAEPAVRSAVPAQRTPSDRAAVYAERSGPIAGMRRLYTERHWVRAGVNGGLLWVATYLAYALVMIVFRIGEPVNLPFDNAMQAWRQWDANWYLIIAQQGYGPGAPSDGNRIAAFFPLYPVLIRGLDPVLPGNGFVAAMVISAVALFGTLTVLYRLAEHEFDSAVARRFGWYLMIFPTGFFLVAPYPLSLFLLLAVTSVYAMRVGNWWVAGLAGGLAAATRSLGLFLCVPFAIEYLRQHGYRVRRIRWDVVAGVLIPAGLAAFMLHTYLAVGDAFAFSKAQTLWTRGFQLPWESVINSVKEVNAHGLLYYPPNKFGLGAVLFALALIGLSLVGPWRLRRDQLSMVVMSAVMVLFVTSVPVAWSGEPLMSASRHVLEAFPIFLVLARLGAHVFLDRAYTFAALGLHGVLLAHYLHGGWVA